MTLALLQFKEGVTIICNKYSNTCFAALQWGFAKHGYGVVTVTAGTDGTHMVNSYHAKGRAWDIRSRNVKPADQQPLATTLRSLLPAYYDVVVESDHFHIEADAKKELLH